MHIYTTEVNTGRFLFSLSLVVCLVNSIIAQSSVLDLVYAAVQLRQAYTKEMMMYQQQQLLQLAEWAHNHCLVEHGHWKVIVSLVLEGSQMVHIERRLLRKGMKQPFPSVVSVWDIRNAFCV